MLISGELFIHLKDKSVQQQKVEETLRSLSVHFDKLDGVLQEQSSSYSGEVEAAHSKECKSLFFANLSFFR